MKDLFETPIAAYGDWTGSSSPQELTSTGFRLYWDVVEQVEIKDQKFIVAKAKDAEVWICGRLIEKTIQTKLGPENKKVFQIYFRIDFEPENEIGQDLGYGKLYNVSGVFVAKTHRAFGVSTFMYKYLISKYNFCILGDQVQYIGARKLWSRLSKDLDCHVDIVDISSMKILQKDVILHHGEADEDFDPEIYSYDFYSSKKYIRLILTKVF